MSKSKRGWLAVAAALAVGASGVAWADDGGDNGMNPMYGDSYATLQGQGHNIGTPRMQPEGAFAAHEMDNQPTTPLIDRMRQAQANMAEQTRHNWDTMVEKTHAMTDRMRTAMNTQGSTASSTDQTPSAAGTSSATSAAPSATSAAPKTPASPSSAPKGLTGSTSAPSPAGQVVASPPANIGEPMVTTPSQPTTASGVKIAPVNPRGQGPTVVTGPGGG